MTLVELKLLLLAATLAAGWLGGALPLLWAGQPFQRQWIGAGNAFAAGLFLALGLLHLLPESARAWHDAGYDYPVPFLLAVGSFLLMLLLEHTLLPDAGHHAAHAHSGEGLHSHGPAGDHETHGQLARPYVLVVALSVHSVLAGLALGTGTDRIGTLATFAALLVHKATAGLALGLALEAGRVGRRRGYLLVTCFALMTPLGIVLGLSASGLFAGEYALFNGGASALAAGTFLYIGAFDLLQDESLRAGRRGLKWVCAVAGVTTAAVLAIWL